MARWLSAMRDDLEWWWRERNGRAATITAGWLLFFVAAAGIGPFLLSR